MYSQREIMLSYRLRRLMKTISTGAIAPYSVIKLEIT